MTFTTAFIITPVIVLLLMAAGCLIGHLLGRLSPDSLGRDRPMQAVLGIAIVLIWILASVSIWLVFQGGDLQ